MQPDLIDYKIVVNTGDVMGAGTDAKVTVVLFSTAGDTGDKRLRNSDKPNPFENNQVDTFKVNAKNVGDLKKLIVGHGMMLLECILTCSDNTGSGPGWFLERITVIAHQQYHDFYCNRWLDKNEDDKQIVWELKCVSVGSRVIYIDTKIGATRQILW